MQDTELKTIIGRKVDDAETFLESTISLERQKNLDYYLGERYGNEKDNRSQVVTREVLETIDWIMPAIMKVFHSSDSVVSFQPVEPGDEEQADLSTEYVNYVYNRDNSGFLNTHSVAKDGLLEKYGILKVVWRDEEDIRQETLHGLTEDELLMLVSPDTVEVVEQRETENGLFDVTIKHTIRTGKVCCEPVPPEEFLIGRRAKTLKDADFLAHRQTMTRSELIQMGYDRELIESLPHDNEEDYSGEKINRYEYEGGLEKDDTEFENNEIEVIECYLRVDYDDDGIAEYRRVLVAGAAREILDNEVTDYHPFIGFTPVLMSHRVIGLAIADLVRDKQVIKSTILRQMLDGLYRSVNPRYEVQQGNVNLDDLLNDVPGGIIRSKQIGSVNPIVQQWVGAQAFPMLEYIDNQIESQTGVNDTSAGTNPNLLNNQTASGINQVMSKAAEKVELIIRIFAETYFKQVFQKILHLLVKHQETERLIQLNGKWVSVDPGQWNPDMDLVAHVGLGTGNKDQILLQLNNILQIQREIMVQAPQSGMVTFENIHNTLKEMTKNAGLPSVDPYFNSPVQTSPQAPQGQEGNNIDSLAQAEMMKAEQQHLESQNKIALEREKFVHKARMDEKNFDLDAAELEAKYEVVYDG